MKRKYLFIMSLFCLWPWRLAHALAVSNVSFSNTTIPFETSGVPNGTTISFTIDSPGNVQINVLGGIRSFGDAGTLVATLNQTYNAAGAQTLFWNGLWLINGDQGRVDSNFQFS